MSYNIQTSRIASEVRDGLSAMITEAMRTASPDEHELIQLAGQSIHYAIANVDDEHLVDVQAYGTNVPSTGTRTFYVSVQSRAIRSPAADARDAVKPWTPDQGPFVLKSAQAAGVPAEAPAERSSRVVDPAPNTAAPQNGPGGTAPPPASNVQDPAPQ